MTDEERAKAVIIGWNYRRYENTHDSYRAFVDGYAKACEHKRAEIEWLMELLSYYAQDVYQEVITGRLKIRHTDF